MEKNCKDCGKENCHFTEDDRRGANITGCENSWTPQVEPSSPAALLAALDPFVRLLSIIDAIPVGFHHDEEPLRHFIPGMWPTVSDLRKLINTANAAPHPERR